MHHQEQIGDYVVELPHPKAEWIVRMAGDDKQISHHNTKRDAIAAVKNYQAADRRRAG